MNIYKLRFVFFTLITIILLSACGSKKQRVKYADIVMPKREFRGAWFSTAWQSRYKSMTPEQMKVYFVKSLDQLHADGFNAIIFQARPQADAFYPSKLEPWSAHFTGVQGKAPIDGFDPLAFLVDECHKRNMELHVWLNPYRVTTSSSDVLDPSHLYFKEPDRFVKYDGQIYFDPGIPKNRTFICNVVKDITMRYDIDAIHMDDYFYPYPVAGLKFPDDNSFAKYASEQGFNPNQKNDWRRNNVSTLIHEIKATIMNTKPWVRFGISPFGIYRNQRSTDDKSGSNTLGLQNYDDLYADVKLWVDKGWIDYNMPQIYWEIGHKSADYTTLVEWWAENTKNRPLYIGQDVKRTMDAVTPSGDSQLNEKIVTSRSYTAIGGSCFWPAYEILDNYKGISDKLEHNHYKYPALIPPYTHMNKKRPQTVSSLKQMYTKTSHVIRWSADSDEYNPESAQYFVVYRFPKGEKENLNDPRYIVAITRDTRYVLPYEGGKNQYKYVVTAVDRFHNESKAKSVKVTL